MGNLPVSVVVDVTITRETIFPTRRGFGTQLIVTAENTGPLNAGVRTRSYRSIDEVAADWAPADEAYKAAQTAFSQKPCADLIKIGWRDILNAVDAELDDIQAYDSDWYGLTFTKEVRDNASVLLAAAWCEARVKVYASASNDADVPGNVAGNTPDLLQNLGYDRTLSFYHDDADLYPDVAFFARAFAVEFDKPNSAITMKFKRLFGITTVDLNSSQLRYVTGFVPGQGLDDTAGFFANTYITVGGLEFVVEGNMASGEFFDIIHFMDWLQSAIQLEILGRLVNASKIPYTNVGTQSLVEGVGLVLGVGVAANAIASDVDEDGNTMPEFEISVQRVEDVLPAQRANRIAPDILFTARLAGAIHYSTITGKLVV